MASFKASHPKRHDLSLARTGGEGRSLDVRAHLKGLWRRVVKKINASSGPSKEIAGLKKMMRIMTPGSQIRVCGNSRMKRSRYIRRGPLGLCVDTYGPLECSGEFLKPS